MSGYKVQPTTESHVIAMLARALWEKTGFGHSTHYLEVDLPNEAIAAVEKSELAWMKDEHVGQCAGRSDHLLVLIVTGQEGDGVVTFMALSLPMVAKS